MASCGLCEIEVSKVDESIQCSGCKKSFHPTCTKLRTMDKFKKLGNKKATWRCDSCSDGLQEDSVPDSNTVSILDAIKSVEIKLLKRFDGQDEKISGIEASLSQLQTSYGNLKTDVEALKSEQLQLQSTDAVFDERIKTLQKENWDLKLDIRDLQQYSRKNNIEITGMPITKNEDICCILENIAMALKITFNRLDIATAHRVPSKTIPNIVVRFVSLAVRDTWLSASRRRKGLSTGEINKNLPMNSVYINEHLSPHNKFLLAEARKMKKASKIAFAWVKNGRVLIKVRENDKAIWLRDECDLDFK
jgi:hypothetical protein